MKYTKQAENKRKGDKITFRINTIEDKKLIQYIEKAKNGSAFIKEAIRFYIKAIESGIVDSYYLTDEDKKWDNVMNNMNETSKEIIDSNIFDDVDMHIDLFDQSEDNKIELKIDWDDFDDEYTEEYKDIHM